MTLEKIQAVAKSRKKTTVGIIFLMVFLLFWQISTLFGKHDNRNSSAGGSGVVHAQTPPPAVPAGKVPANVTPKPTEVPQPAMTDQEKALMTMQQETQVKYLEKINELQLLKVSRDIATTNKEISTAQLARVEAEKKIVDLLSPSAPPPSSATTTTTTETTLTTLQSNYSVVSITQLQYKWGAVLSYRGTLYNVSVGDVLPPDGSTVVGISRDSVTLQNNGVRKRLTLVPII